MGLAAGSRSDASLAIDNRTRENVSRGTIGRENLTCCLLVTMPGENRTALTRYLATARPSLQL